MFRRFISLNLLLFTATTSAHRFDSVVADRVNFSDTSVTKSFIEVTSDLESPLVWYVHHVYQATSGDFEISLTEISEKEPYADRSG